MHETFSFFSGLILGSLLTLLLKPILLRASRRRAGRSELDTPLLPVASPAENATSAVASGTPAAYRPPKTALPTRSVVAAGGTLADETAETDQLLETVEGGGSLENAISVTVDNCSDQLATLVRVVVSDRTGLLAEMSAVLSGLGLSHGRKVVGRSRLAAIEQRMHDWARSGWLRQGIQRLIDRDAAATGLSRSIGSANSISALADGALEPPEPLRDAVRDAAPPEGPEEEEEPLLRAALCAALRCGALPFGSLPPGLAGDLAAAALPRMRRCRLPAGAELRSDSAWLLLLEDEATASVERAAATAPSSTQLRRATRSTAAWGEGGGGGGGCVAEEGGEPLSVPLPALSVLWELLSDLPVLAPLSPRRMLALCRRAVEVVLPPLTVALPPRLRARDTLGEAGALHGSALPRGVRISSCGAGARLLCWPRDSSLGEALSRLPELLPAGWSSRAELGCLAQAPGLGRKLLRSGALRPLGADLSALSATRDGRSTPLLCLVACGTLLETLPVSVTISPLSQRGGGGSSFEDLGLAVLSARIRTETGADGSEVAHDVFTVAPRGAAALADTASLLRRVESQLREMLAVNALHAGDATLLSDTHDLRAPPQAPQPLSVYCLDLPAAVALLAADDSPLALGEGAPRTVGDLYRTLLEARRQPLVGTSGGVP
ncbi:hypothetical protein EMIHUDRAFT_227421 [Emiliania huxleyi CCMP1516]|uniref:ACT domain-containing protein n=2 Tax=Emiliania huxleyi TaxID=2903 RepID=A0A0D3KIQ9_EMIH1|nr:hypothetical protein EMIHUDRAFT_227421 [Emiliania huxleyi CCMP1516]EOD35644.1 hypothetical protein EMIHUDRAFT_227421 [Emiliania huxleyi CCMP1516]|eukprot:XP_005788073.1 hypothetical protein EMIHUDRAFT_227421 [Emiliania huxleyi CCMP1516]